MRMSARKLFLMLSTVTTFSVGCDQYSLPEYPVKSLYSVDQKHSECHEYELTDPLEFKYKFKRTIDYAQCPTVIGHKVSDLPRVLDWNQKIIKKFEELRGESDSL